MALLGKKLLLLLAILAMHTPPIIAKDAPPAQQQEMTQKDVEHFAIVMTQIQHYYIKPTHYKTLFENAIRGMLNGLDPHSAYLDSKTLKALNSRTDGNYAGIGLQLVPENGLLKVIAPFDNTPAAKAHLEPGDILLKVNQYFIKDIGPDQAITRLLGRPGSTLKLTVFKIKIKKPKVLTLTREIIKIKSTQYRLLPPHIGYIRIAIFGHNTQKEIKHALVKLAQENKTPLKALILDVRNNPGGTLNAAIDTTNLFLDADTLGENTKIVSTSARIQSMRMEAHATPGDVFTGKPIIILINNGSASASEILASALSEHNRAITLGTKTFGKGSIQAVIPTSPTSAIKLTTGLYYTPKGHAIQAKGVLPDVIVPYKTIPKSEETQTLNEVIDESQLYRHLKTKPQKTDTRAKQLHTQAQKRDLDLAHSDFQLYQAIKLLQGMLAIRE